MGEEMQAPEWLTVDFLQSCLRSDERYKGITITKFVVRAGVPPGNNFGSIIYRVTIDYKDANPNDDVQSLSVIVKAPLTEGPFKDSVESTSTEPSLYNEFLPKAEKLLTQSFAPNHFPSSDPSVIVMEDLKAQGYLMCDKTKGLDYEHCKLYMTAAAKFHAVSHVISKETPEIIASTTTNSMFSSDSEIGELSKKPTFYGVECMAKHIGKIKGYEKYSKLLKKYSMAIWNDLENIHQPKEDFNCFIQGDPWIANMLFKYDDDGKVSDVKLLDFQVVTFLCPVRDIVFFIHICANYEVQNISIDDLLQVYVTELNSNLKKLNCDYSETYEHFKEEVYRFIPIVVWVHAVATPGLKNTTPDVNGIYIKSNENPPLSENPFEEFYTEDYCATCLPHLVKLMEQEGVFRFLEKKFDFTHDIGQTLL